MNSIDNFMSLFRDMNLKLNGKLMVKIESGNTTNITVFQGNKKIFSVLAASMNAAVDLAFSKLMDYKKEVFV